MIGSGGSSTVRDLWNPLGQRDRGYFRIFVPLMICVFGFMAFSRTTYLGLLIGMLLASIAYSFVFAAFQGFTALNGQEALMTGRLSALSNIFLFLPVGAAYFASGFMSEHLSPPADLSHGPRLRHTARRVRPLEASLGFQSHL